MRAFVACLALLLAGCGTREAAAPRYICDRLATERTQPYKCVPQAAAQDHERSTVPPGEARLLTPNGAIVGQTTVIGPPEKVLVLPPASP